MRKKVRINQGQSKSRLRKQHSQSLFLLKIIKVKEIKKRGQKDLRVRNNKRMIWK